MHKILLLSLSLLLFALGSTRLVAGERKVIIALSVWTGYPENIRGFKETMAAAGFTENETVTYLYGKSNINTVTQSVNQHAIMTTTDTLCQGGGEESLIEISKEFKIPILSSNKNGIEEGSSFGPVADFYTLGKMSAEMAIKILRDQKRPYQLHTRVQQPPLILINKGSCRSLGIAVPEDKLNNSNYIVENKK